MIQWGISWDDYSDYSQNVASWKWFYLWESHCYLRKYQLHPCPVKCDKDMMSLSNWIIGLLVDKGPITTTNALWQSSVASWEKNGEREKLGQQRLEVGWEVVMLLFNIVNLNV